MELIFYKMALLFYSISVLFSFIYLASKRERLAYSSGCLLANGILLHLVSFGLRMVSFWSVPDHRYFFPLHTFFGVLSYLGLATMVVLGIIEWRYKLRVLSAFVLPFGWLACGGALVFADPALSVLPEALRSHWINIHPLVLMTMYAVLLNAFGVGAALLVQERQLKSKHPGAISYRLPSVEELDQLNCRLILLAFPLLTLGVVVGGLWAHGAWGRFWGWDAKEIWALVTWCIYGVYFHLRFFMGIRGRKLVYVSSLGFASIIFTFAAVNHFSHLHGYLSGG